MRARYTCWFGSVSCLDILLNVDLPESQSLASLLSSGNISPALTNLARSIQAIQSWLSAHVTDVNLTDEVRQSLFSRNVACIDKSVEMQHILLGDATLYKRNDPAEKYECMPPLDCHVNTQLLLRLEWIP
jgi:hypothetical protein